MQVDWAACGRVQVGETMRKSLGFRRCALLQPIDLHRIHPLARRKAEFYRGIVNALNFFGGSPSCAIIFEQLEGRRDQRLGPVCLFSSRVPGALCGYFRLQPIACESARSRVKRNRRRNRAVLGSTMP